MTIIDAVSGAAAVELDATYPDLDHDTIATAAANTAAALRGDGVTETVFAPNDDTVYRFVVANRPQFVTSDGPGAVGDGWRDIQHPYFVALLGPEGGAHEWSGDPVHYTYTAEKWVSGRVGHTAMIVSLFLGYLSRALES